MATILCTYFEWVLMVKIKKNLLLIFWSRLDQPENSVLIFGWTLHTRYSEHFHFLSLEFLSLFILDFPILLGFAFLKNKQKSSLFFCLVNDGEDMVKYLSRLSRSPSMSLYGTFSTQWTVMSQSSVSFTKTLEQWLPKNTAKTSSH